MDNLLAVTGVTMQKRQAINFEKLLGFANAVRAPEAVVNFKDKTVDARIGAKVGVDENCLLPDLREMGLRPRESKQKR